MKKFLVICFAITAILMCNIALAANPITVKLNESYIDFTDEAGNIVEPKIINNRTMVPMRKIFEVLGCTINWDGETRTVTAVKEDTNITLQINNDKAILKSADDEETITLDSAPVILNNRTMVPVRFIAESLEKKVGWDPETRTVIIIDLEHIEQKIKEELPLAYELSELIEKNQNQNVQNIDIEGTLKYSDKDAKANSETISISGEINATYVNNIVQANIELEFDGKGKIYDAIVEGNQGKIYMEMIFDINNSVYYARTFFEGEYSEWRKEELEITTKETLTNEDNLSVDTYENLVTVTNLLMKLLDENYLKVSGSTTKTYTWKVELADLFDVISQISYVSKEEYEEILKKVDAGITYKAYAKKDVITKKVVEFEMDFKSEETNEELTIDLEFTAKGKEDNTIHEIIIPEV